jgi:hypothetical protein
MTHHRWLDQESVAGRSTKGRSFAFSRFWQNFGETEFLFPDIVKLPFTDANGRGRIDRGSASAGLVQRLVSDQTIAKGHAYVGRASQLVCKSGRPEKVALPGIIDWSDYQEWALHLGTRGRACLNHLKPRDLKFDETLGCIEELEKTPRNPRGF